MHHPDPSARRAARLERLVLGHVALTGLVASWAFGGQSPGARTALLLLGTAGILLATMTLPLLARRQGRRSLLGATRWLWPLLAFDALVAAACLNPSFRAVLADGDLFWVQQEPLYAWLPSSADPDRALRELWLLNGLVISAHNLLVISSRGALRRLLLVLAANAALLAVVGTLQKLLGAPGPWFGMVSAPNPFFFSTFVYHNHWGAFALLHAAVWTGLVFHHLARASGRDLWHSPAPAGALAVGLLAATAPLSGSRSSSALFALLVLVAGAHFAIRLVWSRRSTGRPLAGPLVGLGLALALAIGAIVALARPVIEQRASQTVQQVAALRDTEEVARVALYRDTWRMAAERPWFGWGLESYGRVFPVFNTQRPTELWFEGRFYTEAHNDWLQSLAESGFVGTGLVVLLALLPVAGAPWRRGRSALPRYLLAGLGLILLYAGVEFPLANPAVVLTCWTLLYAAVRLTQLDAANGSASPRHA